MTVFATTEGFSVVQKEGKLENTYPYKVIIGVIKIQAVEIQHILGKQAILLPNNLNINDNKVYLKKVGNVIYIIPFHSPWQNFYDSLSHFSDDFMNDRNQPLLQQNH